MILMPSVALAQFGSGPFGDVDTSVLGGDLTLENGEIISNSTDGIICLEGGGGTNNEDICFDLETIANVILVRTNTGAIDIMNFADSHAISFGSAQDTRFQWTTTGNDNLQIGTRVGGANGSGYLSLMATAGLGDADRSPDADWVNGATPADSTWCVTSADGTNKLDHGCQWHDQANYNIGAGTGGIQLVSLDVPAVSSCGTTPSITGNSNVGKVTIGSSASSTCTLTFDVAFSNEPGCSVVNGTVDVPVFATTTTTTLVITDGGQDFSSDVIMYVCFGY